MITKAGMTELPYGTPVKIVIPDPENDGHFLDGLTGEATHPYPGLMRSWIKYTDWIGVRLNDGWQGKSVYSICNVPLDEIEVII